MRVNSRGSSEITTILSCVSFNDAAGSNCQIHLLRLVPIFSYFVFVYDNELKNPFHLCLCSKTLSNLASHRREIGMNEARELLLFDKEINQKNNFYSKCFASIFSLRLAGDVEVELKVKLPQIQTGLHVVTNSMLNSC